MRICFCSFVRNCRRPPPFPQQFLVRLDDGVEQRLPFGKITHSLLEVNFSENCHVFSLNIFDFTLTSVNCCLTDFAMMMVMTVSQRLF